MSDEAKMAEPRVSVQIEPLLVRRTDAARLLAISPRLFDDLVLAGLIGKVRVGGVVAYEVDELRAFARRAKAENYCAAEIAALVEKSKSTRNGRRRSPAKSVPG